MSSSKAALKEWAWIVEALGNGDQLLIVRKGGLLENGFQLKHREFFLYPTWEHQEEEAIRSEFRQKYHASPPEGSSEISFSVAVGVAFWGIVRDVHQLTGLEKLHIWTPHFFEKRMQYRPEEPTIVALLRAYRLPKEIIHPVQPGYAGCTSWVDLSQEIPMEGAVPVVDNQKFRHALEQVSSRLD